jgi:hypothetical protein
LGDVADLGAPAGDVVGLEGGEVGVVKESCACAGRDEAVDELEEGALAGAGGADDGYLFTG